MRKVQGVFWLLFCCICISFRGRAQELLALRDYPVSARMLYADELGNVYLVRQDNTLLKLSAAGDSLSSFSGLSNGDIDYLDVTNPLRVLVLYRDFAKLQILDRMLAPKSELNLRKVNLVNTSVVASSAEGFLWVYDQFAASLNKLDMDLNLVVAGYDLRPQLGERPVPLCLVERDRKVYMVDSALGVLVFDQFGSYLNTLEIKGLRKVQLVGGQLIYRRDTMLYAYDLQRFTEKQVRLPAAEQLLDAAWAAEQLYLLYPDRLRIYRLR